MASGTPTRTTCPYCGVSWGGLATPQADGSVAIRGRRAASGQFRPPLLEGVRLCGETLSLDEGCFIRKSAGDAPPGTSVLDLVAAPLFRDHCRAWA